ncbi:MAG: STAS/SEC14 domain-containing protein [Gemmataceae bacterium]
MLDILESGAPNILRVRASGRLTDADHAAFLRKLEYLAHRYGRVRVLLDMTGLDGCDACSGWDDPVVSLRWKDAVKRFAVVGREADRAWEKPLTEPFVNVRFFPPSRREEGWRWVCEGAEEEIDKEWIRHLAYAKWEAAGRPADDAERFWLEAEREPAHTV